MIRRKVVEEIVLAKEKWLVLKYRGKHILRVEQLPAILLAEPEKTTSLAKMTRTLYSVKTKAEKR